MAISWLISTWSHGKIEKKIVSGCKNLSQEVVIWKFAEISIWISWLKKRTTDSLRWLPVFADAGSLICWTGSSIITCWSLVLTQTTLSVLLSIPQMICIWLGKALFRLKKKSAVLTRRNSWHMSVPKLQEMECIICCWMKFSCWIVLNPYWMVICVKIIWMYSWPEVTQSSCQRILWLNLQVVEMKFICIPWALRNSCPFTRETNIWGYLSICFTAVYLWWFCVKEPMTRLRHYKICSVRFTFEIFLNVTALRISGNWKISWIYSHLRLARWPIRRSWKTPLRPWKNQGSHPIPLKSI